MLDYLYYAYLLRIFDGLGGYQRAVTKNIHVDCKSSFISFNIICSTLEFVLASYIDNVIVFYVLFIYNIVVYFCTTLSLVILFFVHYKKFCISCCTLAIY
jgi:hypothetical protein